MEQTRMDKETFCAQVIRHQEAMFRAAKAILKQDEDAEDAVQEAICAAFAARDGLRDVEKFKPWILRILTNKCYDAYRKKRRPWIWKRSRTICPLPGRIPTDRLTLWQAVMSLSDDLRATVTLYYYDGLSVREIGTVLGISEAAVKTRLSRGRGRLRQLLREE